MKTKAFLKKHWSNILFVIFLGLILYPKTGGPIKIFVNRLIAFAPSEKKESNRETLQSWDWWLLNEEGQRVNLSDHKGQVVIINQWATWCPPCVAEMPSFDEVYQEYGDKVVFLFVSNEGIPKTSEFLQRRSMTLPIYQAYSNPPEQLRSQSIPATFVLDRKGRIAVKKIGAADWNASKFRKLLDELYSEQI